MDFYRVLRQTLGMHSLWNMIHKRDSRRYRLSVLLSSCRTAKATHPIDKIYTLLGISSDYAEFGPNYYVSKAQVYSHYAWWHIYKAGGKEPLYESARSDRTLDVLSSWIPVWSEIPTRHNLGRQWSRTGNWLFSAGGEQSEEGPKASIRLETNLVLLTKSFIPQTVLILSSHPED